MFWRFFWVLDWGWLGVVVVWCWDRWLECLMLSCIGSLLLGLWLLVCIVICVCCVMLCVVMLVCCLVVVVVCGLFVIVCVWWLVWILLCWFICVMRSILVWLVWSWGCLLLFSWVWSCRWLVVWLVSVRWL